MWECVCWVYYFSEEIVTGRCVYEFLDVISKGLKSEFEKRVIPYRNGFFDLG